MRRAIYTGGPPSPQASAPPNLHSVPQGGLKAFAGVELSTCCSLLELLYCDGSPYQGAAVLSKGGKLMAGALRSPDDFCAACTWGVLHAEAVGRGLPAVGCNCC